MYSVDNQANGSHSPVCHPTEPRANIQTVPWWHAFILKAKHVTSCTLRFYCCPVLSRLDRLLSDRLFLRAFVCLDFYLWSRNIYWNVFLRIDSIFYLSKMGCAGFTCSKHSLCVLNILYVVSSTHTVTIWVLTDLLSSMIHCGTRIACSLYPSHSTNDKLPFIQLPAFITDGRPAFKADMVSFQDILWHYRGRPVLSISSYHRCFINLN